MSIPIIEIDDGWTVDDVKTFDDCDDAFALLTSIIASMDYQLDMHEIEPRLGDPTWAPRTRAALRFKKAALQIVQNKRGRIERKRRETEQKHFYEVFRNIVHRDNPDQLAAWLKETSEVVARAAAGISEQEAA